MTNKSYIVLYFCFLMFFSVFTHAEEDVEIISNTDFPTKYYEMPDLRSKVLGEFVAGEIFNPHLIKIELKDGFIKFEKDGVKAWVLLRNVNTNRKIRMNEACGAMPNDKIKKNVASTRGIGETCKK